MPAKWFKCPDGEQIEIADCLKSGGCRMGQRCSTLPYLRMIGYDREWRGVSPSSAGNGPRLMYLKQVVDYAIDPNDRAFAALGTAVHGKLSLQAYTFNVLSEESLNDDQMRGISDVLEADEIQEGWFILSDYKTWGSFKVAKAKGIYQVDAPVLDDNGNQVVYKTGEKKGQPKTRKETRIDPGKADLISEEYQLNRYRIFFERLGFKVSRLQIQAIPRDGGTYIAQGRGIDKNIYIIPVKRLDDEKVLGFYDNLKAEVDQAFKDGFARKCNAWECWDGRRCSGFCEVAEACKKMDVREVA